MPSHERLQIFTGTFVHTPKLGELEVLENTAVYVSGGVIVRISPSVDAEGNDLLRKDVEEIGWRWEDVDVVEPGGGKEMGRKKRCRWWFPGFVDTHTHASQFPNAGVFGKTTLLDWLNTYTFPLEASLSSPSLARPVYTRAVNSTLRNGTTTAAYYATASAASTNELAKVCHEKGQRAFVGRCNMDSDLQPEWYRDRSVEQAVEDTMETVRFCRGLELGKADQGKDGLVSAIVTPRFAPSCSEELLMRLGELARREDLPVQTHVSENEAEIALVKSLFPNHDSYTHVYDSASLLTPRTVLAHGVHLTPPERVLIKARGSSVSHCPVSNSALSSGLCRVRTLLDDEIEVGLGTDVSGGYSPSVLAACREAGVTGRVLAGVGWECEDTEEGAGKKMPTQHERDRSKLSPEECLYLATRGGARCLGLGDKIGAFEVGMEFDAQEVGVEVVQGESGLPLLASAIKGGESGDTLVDKESGQVIEGDEDEKHWSNVQLWTNESWSDRMAKWVFGGDDRNTERVYVRGREVWAR